MPTSPTLATYRTEVRRLLHDSTGKFWSNAELNDYINDARERVSADTGCLRSLVIGALSPSLEQYPIGGVTGGTVTAGGTGYSAPTVSFSGGGGTGAVGVLTISAGVVTGIAITDPGTGYTSPPTATVFPGTGILAVLLIIPGLGFTTVPTVHFAGTGSGAVAAAHLGVQASSFAAIGTGYAPGDVCTVSSGSFTRPFKLLIDSVNGSGGVTVASVLDAGDYLAPFGIAQPTTTTGVGTGFTITGTAYFVSSVVVTTPGTGYQAGAGVFTTGGGASLQAAGTATVGGGTGSGAAITMSIIPLDTVDILNVTVLRGNQRVPMGYMSFTEFNATMRCLTQNPQFPYRWSRYGTSGGTAFLQPVPDVSYPVEWDTCILPDALVADGDIDVLQYPYTSPVAYYAAWKAKLKQQSYGEAEGFLKQYGQKVLMAQAAVQMRRIPNPYGGYSGS